MRRARFDPSKVVLVEQSLKLSPSERFQYAMGLATFALRANPNLLQNREVLFKLRAASDRSRRSWLRRSTFGV